MAFAKYTCPECGHSFSGSAVVSPTCPKCATTITDRESAAVGKDRSYRNSWQRYAVLTVLIAVMGVLAYMLYEKRMNAGGGGGAAAGDDDDLPLAKAVVKPGTVPPPGLPTQPIAAGASTGGPPPKAKGRTIADIREALAGTWESKTGDQTATIVYKADGTFTYTATGLDKPIAGKWTLADPSARGTGPMMTWTADGHDIPPAGLIVRGTKIEKHPLLHRPADAAAFDRK